MNYFMDKKNFILENRRQEVVKTMSLYRVYDNNYKTIK